MIKMWETLESIRPKVINYLCSKNIYKDDAEDIFQDCCIILLGKYGMVGREEIKNLEALLISYAKNCAKKQYTKYKKQQMFKDIESIFYNKGNTPEIFIDYRTPETQLLKESSVDLQMKVVTSETFMCLSKRNKKLIFYRYFYFLPKTTIAKLLNISTTAVEQQIYKFKTKIQNEQKRHR